MRVAILTSIYDTYDTLKDAPVQQGVATELICVTDDSTLKSDCWKIVHEPRPGVHPNLAAKKAKMLPRNYTDADVTVWVDASFEIISHFFAKDMLEYLPLAQFVHPWRNCIYAEADYSCKLPKYECLPLRTQALHYRDCGHPEAWGLWAAGVIVMDHTNAAVARFGAEWHAECERWGYHDQVSEAFILRNNQLRPNALPGTHLTNKWLSYLGSGRH